MEAIFKPGDVVMTPHGKGVVIGPDMCNDAPKHSEPRMISTGRRIVKLDEGHTWGIKTPGVNPAYWPHDLKHI